MKPETRCSSNIMLQNIICLNLEMSVSFRMPVSVRASVRPPVRLSVRSSLCHSLSYRSIICPFAYLSIRLSSHIFPCLLSLSPAFTLSVRLSVYFPYVLRLQMFVFI